MLKGSAAKWFHFATEPFFAEQSECSKNKNTLFMSLFLLSGIFLNAVQYMTFFSISLCYNKNHKRNGLTEETGLEIKIYIDVLLLINLLFNYSLLWTTSLLLRHSIKTLRLLMAAFGGALYAVCVFFLPASFLYGLLGKLIMGAIMAAVAFRPGCLRAFVKVTCVFYLTVFIIGGAAFSLFYFADAAALPNAVQHNGSLYINLPMHYLLLLIVLCHMLAKTAFALCTRISAAKRRIVTLRVVLNGCFVLLRGFCDSGNLLRDHQDRGVMITKWQCVRPLFKNVETPEKSAVSLLTFPYHTLQGAARIKAFLPDAMYIEKKHQWIPLEPLYIGIISDDLDFYNNWDTILPHDFEEVEHNEANCNSRIVNLLQNKRQANY